jgi:hypothetical protein
MVAECTGRDTKRLLAMRRMAHYLVQEAAEVGLPDALILLDAAAAVIGRTLQREIRLVVENAPASRDGNKPANTNKP